MKKFFSVWFVALLCGFTTAVSASVTVTLNAEPSDVSISGLTPDGGSWVKGENTCTVSYGSAYMNVSTSLTDKVLDAAITSSGSTTHRNSTSGLYSVYVQDGASVVISLYDVETLRTATFTLNVADASKVQLFRSDNTEVTLANGNNTVKFADGSHESEYAETSFTVRTSESDVLLTYSSSNLEPTSNYSTLGSLTFPAKDGATVSVSLYNLDDIRTASVTVNVDEPSKLSVVRGGRYIYFSETNKTINFVSSHSSGYSESNFTFSGNGNWYTLKSGDNTLSSFSSNYNWTATNGATIDVTFTAPAVDVSVKFEGTIDAFSKVEVNDVEVDKATWSAADYSVKLGSEIKLYGNNTDYSLDSLKINGTKLDSYSNFFSGYAYSFTVTETSDYTINLSAKKLEPFDIYLTVNHPELFSVSSSSDGSSPYAQVVVDEAEPNRLKVTLPGKTSYVYFNALDGCSFDSIKNGAGTHLLSYPSTSTSINNLEADAEFSVWINKPERTDTLYVYFDYPEYLSGGVVKRKDNEVIAFKYSYESGAAAYNEQYKGWNKIAFDPATENSFYIALYGYYAYIYHNGVQQPGYYGPETSSYGVFTAANNDSIVVNILLSASFNIAGSATVNMVSPADVDPTKTFYVAPETEVQFTTNGSSVQVNYTDDIVADGDGVYTVTVSSNNTSIAIGAPITTAIEAVTIEKPRNNNVYTLQGILLIQNASEAQINALPCGLYIINGEKRIVTNRR